MRLVVTGALGHIGSRLLRALAPLDCREAVLIDNLASQRHASLFNLRADIRWRFVRGDVCDPALDLESAFAGARAVVHLAAITDATASFGRRAEVERVNAGGTERVARACAAAGTPLFFPSTTSVYAPAEHAVDEDAPPAAVRPQTPYAESKLQSERLLAELADRAGLRYFVGRLGTVYGASPGMHFHTAVNRFAWQAVFGEPLTVWRTALDQERPYLDVSDAAEAILHVVRSASFGALTCNLLSGNHVLRTVVELLRREVPDLRVELVDSPAMNAYSYAVSRRRFEALGFRFRGDLARSVGELVSLLRPIAVRAGRGRSALDGGG